MTIKGQPATGDSFTVKASTNQDLFKTLSELTTTVESAQPEATASTKLTNNLNTALSNLDNSLDNVLRVRGHRCALAGSGQH